MLCCAHTQPTRGKASRVETSQAQKKKRERGNQAKPSQVELSQKTCTVRLSVCTASVFFFLSRTVCYAVLCCAVLCSQPRFALAESRNTHTLRTHTDTLIQRHTYARTFLIRLFVALSSRFWFWALHETRHSSTAARAAWLLILSQPSCSVSSVFGVLLLHA